MANLGLRIYKERTICGKPGPQDLQGENYMRQTWASGFTRRELYVANLGLRIYKERAICGKPGPQDVQGENYMWQTWASGFPLLSLQGENYMWQT